MKIYGIDGCRAGWVIAQGRLDDGVPNFFVLADLKEFFREVHNDGSIVAIDIPIGLSEDSARECDRLARKVLSPRRSSSVYPVPCRSAIRAETYEEACELNFRARGRRMSKQSFNIIPKIREVDGLMSPQVQDQVFETHPEVLFALLSGSAMQHNKKKPEGERERLRLLLAAGLDLTVDEVTRIRANLGVDKVQRDDVVDAAALLVSAHRISIGENARYPDVPPIDANGIRMEINA